MLLLKNHIESKLSYAAQNEAKQLWTPFKDLIILPPSDVEVWLDRAKECLKNLLSVVAHKENISPLNSGGEQTFYQYHLPDKITGMLQELEKRLYSEEVMSYPIDEEFWTIAFLIFKVTEWVIWNYSGKSPYSASIEQESVQLFKSLKYSSQVWGDLDEVWFALIERVSTAFSFRYPSFSKYLAGWDTYAAKIHLDIKGDIFKQKIWPDGVYPVSCSIAFGVKMICFDQTKIKLSLTGREQSGRIVYGNKEFSQHILKSLEQEFGRVE